MSGMNTKHKAKSCNCTQCRRSPYRREALTQKERAFRHKYKIALKFGREDEMPVTIYAGYTD